MFGFGNSKLTVEFILKKNGYRVSNGILVYEPVGRNSLSTSPDNLNTNGYAKTYWHPDWNGKEVDVYCHTDGINAGTPVYFGRVTIRHGKEYILKA